MEESMLRPLSSWWRARAQEAGAPSALAQLCGQLAARSDGVISTFLAAQALDLDPTSLEALAVLERDALDSRALRSRYEAFLAAQPEHPAAGLVRDRLAMLLFDHGLTYSALIEIDRSLSDLEAFVSPPAAGQPSYAALVEHDADARLDELERALMGDAPLPFADAAE